MAKPESPRLAILGGGPIGLEAALYARTLELPVALYERGRIGEHLHRWGHVRPWPNRTSRAHRARSLDPVPLRAFWLLFTIRNETSSIRLISLYPETSRIP